MAKWLVVDSLSCPEQFFCSHLDSYGHYLREYGDTVDTVCLNIDMRKSEGVTLERGGTILSSDIVLALDQYEAVANWVQPWVKKIAQVAAVVPVMPWDVRKPDGSPVYDLVLSSIPWMVEAAREKGCRAEYMPLAFDTRARVCGMGVTRDLDCIFIGTTGPNHRRRTTLLEELRDIVTVLPPVFGREYFKTLARAKVVFNVHAEWAKGAANNMRLYEAAGMGCEVVSDGESPDHEQEWWWDYEDARDARSRIQAAMENTIEDPAVLVLKAHTYESRIPRLVELARSL